MDASKFFLWAFLALSCYSSLQPASASEKMSLEKLGHKMDSLSEKIGDFIQSVGKIENVLLSLVEKYTLHDLIDKCVEAIGSGNSIGVNKIWEMIAKNYNVSKAQQILNSIVVESYGGKRESILPLIRFISQTGLCTGFETLFDHMTDYDHFFHGGEIFSLANAIYVTCEERTLFERFPAPVQLMFTHAVSLQNTFNKGFLFRKTQMNDNVMENQVATVKTSNNTSFWRFIPATEFAESFYIKNGDHHLIASSSRRMYFGNESLSKFQLEMNRKAEISIGVSLDDREGKSIFYRLYASKQGTKLQNSQKVKAGDVFELNLWTISPKDAYYKFSFWHISYNQNNSSNTNTNSTATTTNIPNTINNTNTTTTVTTTNDNLTANNDTNLPM